ncbi:protein THEM6-like [Amphibalanus amphitrite]|uniref:protein THEM6-like n=1 Tax=Amphibalanus amphitrite TaxID=1232801 RepID=UPI001C90E2D7|nr:protein THEM6-like [Amphibalanus amphitrite]
MGLLDIIWEHPALAAGAGFFICFDGFYVLRLGVTLVANRLLLRRVSPLTTVRDYGYCAPTDIDVLFHMNNARYVREMDFGRWGYYMRIGAPMFSDMKVLQAAMLVRFRKEISMFTPFVVETRLVHWDEQSLFFEQKLITLHDRRARFVSYSQQRVMGSMGPLQLLAAAFGTETAPPPPPAPESLRAFIEANSAYKRDLAVVEKRA